MDVPIKVRPEVRDMLKAAGRKGESYSDVIEGLVAAANFSEDDVQLAKEYVGWLETAKELAKELNFSEDDIDMAKSYVGYLEAIDRLREKVDFNEDDMEQAQEYLESLNAIKNAEA